ncbi:hypothetical protein Athai_44000 [Actinocatenispora thailandica]|uniref:DUF2785 domain-containing protein n=1 Tax=Actinocatenispora thailandica TaxID=227318 RepID=A0A7R7DSB7_9ACTN|nr:DUF2785 domain-containing protein [Actinocatenispora thailandica]BCJ36897.1 hypothetical protein Athai_44000 [Actinocatenispora thailandica]
MIDWAAVVTADFPVPDDLDGAVAELLDLLTSPDPEVRDGQAYPVLARWIERGVLDDRLAEIGDAMLGRFGHPEVQARTFAPLILACAVRRDTAADLLDAPRLASWRSAFGTWWQAEADIRGWDDELGWLHAVAHGADLVGELASSPRLAAPDLTGLLTLTAERTVAPTGYRYAQQEEDRLALALAAALARPELSEAQATSWLAPVDRLFATGEPGPVPVTAANTFAVLRATYLMVDRRAVPHRGAVTDAIASRMHEVFPPYPAVREPHDPGPAAGR